MDYNIILTAQEIKIITDIIKEVPYKIAKPLLDKIWEQVDTQNLNINPKEQNG